MACKSSPWRWASLASRVLKSVNRLEIISFRVKVRFAICGRAGRRSAPYFRGSAGQSSEPVPLIPGTGQRSRPSWPMQPRRRFRGDLNFRKWAIEGVAAPKRHPFLVQADFIPTMSLGIPGDAVMALLLGALIIQGLRPTS